MKLDDTILEKIRKVKRLADEASNENEGIAAALAFQRLLAQHHLTEAEVLDIKEEPQIEQQNVFSDTRAMQWERTLYVVIGEHFRCKCLTERYTNATTRFSYIGHADDVAVAAETFRTMYRVAARLADDYMDGLGRTRPYGKRKDVTRREYLDGFARGLHAAFKRHEAENNLSIIISTPQDVLDYVADLGAKERSFAPKEKTTTAAYRHGWQDGDNVGRGNIIREGAAVGAID